MIDALDNLIGVIMLIDVYVIVFFRLLVRRDFEQRSGRRESMFEVIFSAPRKKHLSAAGQVSLKRYWVAMGIMGLCVVYIAVTRLISGTFSWPTG